MNDEEQTVVIDSRIRVRILRAFFIGIVVGMSIMIAYFILMGKL